MSKELEAQSNALYSQYMFAMLPLNPAYAGSNENLCMTATYRKQWMDIDGAPSTQLFTANSPIKNKKVALGFSAIHDKIGVTSKTGFYGAYAYRINFNNKSKLSFGLQAGLVNLITRLSQLQTKLPNDPAASVDGISYLLTNVGAGIYWYSKKFSLGLAAPDLMEAKPRDPSAQVIQYKHLFLNGGFVYNISSQIKYKPSILIKRTKGYQLQYDINNIFILNEVVWIGVSYRNAVSVNYILQFQLTNQLSLGYSYDMPISKFTRLAGATHEFMLSYKFVFFKDNAFMPRYF
jgi:type IX secretion system PorP/SprF family membrane protein